LLFLVEEDTILFSFASRAPLGPTHIVEAIGTATSSQSIFTSTNQQNFSLSQVT
jgi:hypothetical protein